MKKNIYWLILFIVILCGTGYWWFHDTTHISQSKTYFAYTDKELTKFKSLSTTFHTTVKDLQGWDELAFDLVMKNELGDKDVSRIFAYLYTAQNGVLSLSERVSGSYQGNIDLISFKVLSLFFPNEQKLKEYSYKKNIDQLENDPYVSGITDLVYKRISDRYEQEKKKTHNYSEREGEGYWKGVPPYFGQDVGSWTPWNIETSQKFRAPPPPPPHDKEWENQLNMSKTALKNATPKQKKAVVFWAGGPGTVTPPGQWIIIANDYMISKHLPLEKMMNIRAVLSRVIADAVIAVFDTKYTYWTKRPNMRDTSIKTIMPTPNHPSYPAGHSIISAAAAKVLIHYFPEKMDSWIEQAEDASSSRVWGAIHFPIDAQTGKNMGEKIADYGLSK